MSRGVKRTRKDNLKVEAEKLEQKIIKCTQDIELYKQKKSEIENEIAEIEAEELRIIEEAREKDILVFIKKNGITKEQLEAFITAQENKLK